MNKNQIGSCFGVGGSIVMMLAALLATTAGCGGGSAPSGAYATPQATLETFKKAGQNKDFNAFVDCLSDTALEEMAGQLRFVGSMLQAVGPMAAMGSGENAAKMKETIGKMEAHMKQHVPADAPAVNMMTMASTPDGGRAAAREAGKVVADKKGFVGGFMKLMAESATEQPFNTFTVSDVKIDGETATAMVKADNTGKDAQVKLRRINGDWKIDDFGNLGTGGASGGGMQGGGVPGGGVPGGGMPGGGPRGNGR